MNFNCNPRVLNELNAGCIFERGILHQQETFSSISSSVCSGYLRTERTPVSAPANHLALRRRFYTLCMPKSEVQEALSSYFSSFVSRSAELEKSFLSYRVCRLDSGLYILSVTKVSEIMSCELFMKLLHNLADFPHRPCFTLISLKWIWASKWDTIFLRSYCKMGNKLQTSSSIQDLNIATKKEVL